MKVMFVIPRMNGGGAERVVANLANYLSERNNVTVLSFANIKTYEIKKNVIFKPLYNGSGKVPHVLINVIRVINLIRYILSSKTDVYITFLPTLTILLLKMKFLTKKPIIIAERCDPKTYCSKSKHNDKNFKKYYKKANGYIFQTYEAYDYYKTSGIDVKNSIIIPNALDKKFVNLKKSKKNTKTIVSVGRMTSQKNFDLLIDSFYELSSAFNDYRLIIYGEGELLESYKEKVKKMKIDNRVFFPGYINNIEEKLCDASIFVLSSNFEGMPNALIEAMAVGLPVISTDCPVGGPKYLIKNGENGILIPVNDKQKMIDAIRTVLSDYDNSLLMGKKASNIKNELEYNKIYGKWEGFIKNYI